MRDPDPSNITGEMVESHVFKHEVNWGHVVLGFAAIYLVWKSGQYLEEGNDEEEGEYTRR